MTREDWEKWATGFNELASESEIMTKNRNFIVRIRQYVEGGASINVYGSGDIFVDELEEWELESFFSTPRTSLFIKWDGCVHAIDFKIGQVCDHKEWQDWIEILNLIEVEVRKREEALV